MSMKSVYVWVCAPKLTCVFCVSKCVCVYVCMQVYSVCVSCASMCVRVCLMVLLVLYIMDDNLSDHEPLCLVLRLNVDLNKVSNRMPTDKITWYKANEIQLAAYREALAANLAAICVPFDAIFVAMCVALAVVTIH